MLVGDVVRIEPRITINGKRPFRAEPLRIVERLPDGASVARIGGAFFRLTCYEPSCTGCGRCVFHSTCLVLEREAQA